MHLERPGTLPLAELIAQRRQAMGLSLNAVGRLMDKAAQAEGTYSLAGRQAVHGYERGRIPRRDSLRWLASALGLPAEEVLAAARRQAANRVMARAADVLSGSMTTGLAGSALSYRGVKFRAGRSIPALLKFPGAGDSAFGVNRSAVCSHLKTASGREWGVNHSRRSHYNRAGSPKCSFPAILCPP